nr:armadillo-like helical domain containing protein 1 [Anas platyrhynchos]
MPQVVSDCGVIPAATASSQRDEAAGAAGGSLAALLASQCQGCNALPELLATSTSAEAQEDAQVLLDSLGRGNPKYQHQVYKGLIAVLPCASPRAQQLALQTLGAMQELVGEAPPALLEPLLAVLGSAHLEVQHEALQLLPALLPLRVRPALLAALVAALTPPGHPALASRSESTADPNALCPREPTLAYIQQAAAAKAIGEMWSPFSSRPVCCHNVPFMAGPGCNVCVSFHSTGLRGAVLLKTTIFST